MKYPVRGPTYNLSTPLHGIQLPAQEFIRDTLKPNLN